LKITDRSKKHKNPNGKNTQRFQKNFLVLLFKAVTFVSYCHVSTQKSSKRANKDIKYDEYIPWSSTFQRNSRTVFLSNLVFPKHHNAKAL